MAMDPGELHGARQAGHLKASTSAMLGRRRVRTRVKLGKRPPDPTALEAAYVANLRRINAQFVRAVKAAVDPYLRRLKLEQKREAMRSDAPTTIDFGKLQLRLARIAFGAEDSVDRFGRRIVSWNGGTIASLLNVDVNTLSPTVRAQLEAWTRENVSLISSIQERLLSDVRDLVTESASAGRRVESLARDLQERYSVSASRAELIATDQTLKFNSALTQTRHAEAGITHYSWSTSRDERVRLTHKELEGTIHSWDDPPITNEDGDRNHPGEDYRCRCVAIPVIDSAGAELGLISGHNS